MHQEVRHWASGTGSGKGSTHLEQRGGEKEGCGDRPSGESAGVAVHGQQELKLEKGGEKTKLTRPLGTGEKQRLFT